MTEFLKAKKEMMERMEAERKEGHEEMMSKPTKPKWTLPTRR
jgi:hypothetical protein